MLQYKKYNDFLRYILNSIKNYKAYVCMYCIFAVILGLNGFINSYLIKWIIDTLVDLESYDYIYQVVFTIHILLILNFELYNISWRVIDYIRIKISPILKNIVIVYAFRHIHKQPLLFFQTSLTGEMSNNINILSDNIERVTNIILVRLIRGIVQMLVVLISMYYVHPIFSIVFLIWAITFIMIAYSYSRKVINLAGLYAENQSKVSGKIVDSIENFMNVKVFAKLKFEIKYLQYFLSKMHYAYRKKEWFLIKLRYFQGLSITCLIGVMLYLLVYLRANNNVSIGDFAFILGLTFYITDYVLTLTEQIDQINDSLGKCKQSIDKIFFAIKENGNIRNSPLTISEGKITFKNVSFQYNDGTKIFKKQSISILPKQKVAILGRSGSGKSTFVHLLLKLFNLSKGNIFIDNQDINAVSTESLYKSIGFINQEACLFNRSLIENITYGSMHASENAVINACKVAQIHDFIVSLPNAYQSVIGERGFTLSGGQRQRILLARIILKNAPILILDEATSQLDSITEKLIEKALLHFIRDKTVLIITHKPSILLKMDRILVFDKNKITEDGSHTDLLNKKGMYYNLYTKGINE